jgi:hypothetical protein
MPTETGPPERRISRGMKISKAFRPSLPVVLASFALVFGMAASAVAGPEDLSRALTKSKVKQLIDKRLRANIPGSHVNLADTASSADHAANSTNASLADHATTATNATYADFATNADIASNADKVDGEDASAFQLKTQHALVAGNCTIISQTGGITGSSEGTGSCVITFPTAVTGRAITATLSRKSILGQSGGEISATLCGQGAEGINCGDTDSDVLVNTLDSAGNPVGQSFYITIID